MSFNSFLYLFSKYIIVGSEIGQKRPDVTEAGAVIKLFKPWFFESLIDLCVLIGDLVYYDIQDIKQSSWNNPKWDEYYPNLMYAQESDDEYL